MTDLVLGMTGASLREAALRPGTSCIAHVPGIVFRHVWGKISRLEDGSRLPGSHSFIT